MANQEQKSGAHGFNYRLPRQARGPAGKGGGLKDEAWFYFFQNFFAVFFLLLLSVVNFM